MGNFKYYTKDNKNYIRISSILEPLSQDKYKHIPKEVLENAAEMGTEIHSLIENMCDGLEIDTDKLTEKVSNCINQWNNVSKDWNVIGNEMTYYNDKLLIAGTIDMLAYIDNKIYLIDLKTRASIYSKDNFLVETLQVLLYKKLFNLDYELGILILNKGHKDKYLFKVIDKDTEKLLSPILDMLIKLAIDKEQNG